MKAVFDHSVDEARDIRSFWFRPGRPLRYAAGQYTELTLRHNNPDNRGIKRWFTLSSAPGGDLVSITTKFPASGQMSSFKQALLDLKPGVEVDLAEAMGDFVLAKDTTIPLIFVAAGIGITPFHSILEWLTQNDQRRDIRFIYSAASERELLFTDIFESAKLQPSIVLSSPSASWTGPQGHLDASHILQIAGPKPNALIYLSGPEQLVEQLEQDLVAHGVKRAHIVRDAFLGY